MTALHDLIPTYRQVNLLCRESGIRLQPEIGDRVAFRGQEHVVLAATNDHLTVVDDLCSDPLDQEQWIVVQEWKNDPGCVVLLGMEQLLSIVHRETTLYPVMTPGVRETQRVWQVNHPNVPPIVSATLEEGLLELTIRILQQKNGAMQAAPGPS